MEQESLGAHMEVMASIQPGGSAGGEERRG